MLSLPVPSSVSASTIASAAALLLVVSRLVLATSLVQTVLKWVSSWYRFTTDILIFGSVFGLFSFVAWDHRASLAEGVCELTGGTYAFFANDDVLISIWPFGSTPLAILVLLTSILIFSLALRAFLSGSKAGKAKHVKFDLQHSPRVFSTSTDTLSAVPIIDPTSFDPTIQQAQIDHLTKLVQHLVLTQQQHMLQTSSLGATASSPEIRTISKSEAGPYSVPLSTDVKCDCSNCQLAKNIHTDDDPVHYETPLSRSIRRSSIESHSSELSLAADLEDPDNEILAIFTWQRQPRAKPASGPSTILSDNDRQALQQLSTVEDIQDFVRNINQQSRRPAARSLTEEEKDMTLDQLDHKWRNEDFMRRQQASIDSLGVLSEEDRELSVAQIKRKIRNKKQQLFFERKRAEGVEVNQCVNCEEWYIGNSHHCTNTGWKLVGQNKDIPVTDQFIITQRGTGDVRVRRRSGADPERVTKAYEALKEVKDKMEADEAAALARVPKQVIPPIASTPLNGYNAKTEKPQAIPAVTTDLTNDDDDDMASQTSKITVDATDQTIPSMHMMSTPPKPPVKACIKGGKRQCPFQHMSQ